MTNSNSNSNSTALTLASPVNDGTASGMSNRHHSSNVAASGMSNGHHSSNSDISSDPSSSSHNFDIADGALEEDARFRYKSSVAALRSIRVYIYSVRESQKKYEGEKAAHRTLKLRKMGRAPCCDKANVKKGPWAPEEDAKLKAYTEKYGTGGNWIALPQKIGCFVTLFSIYAILAHMSGMFSPRSEGGYVETVYPVFSMCALLSLHLFMYGCNLLFWKSTRINYLFIFEFQNHIALKYRDAFLIGTSLMTAVVTAMVIHLILLSSGIPLSQVDALPGVLLLIFLTLLICSLNIFYRPTRYYFLKVMRNIICSPFYKVLMVDFFMADQLTSQIPLLRHIESTACCFVAGSFKTHRYDTCKSGKLYRELAYVVSFAPYYWRAMQAMVDESDVNHLANLGKYVSAMVAAGARITYARHPSVFWMIIVLATSFVATVYQLYQIMHG